MPNIKSTLQQAHDLIAQGWAQNALAKDANGNTVEPLSPTATSWCIRGALRRVCRIDTFDADTDSWHNALSQLESTLKSQYLVDWNDDPSRTKEEVLVLFTRAISQA